MFDFNIQNLGKIDPRHGLSDAELDAYRDSLPDHLANIQKLDQGFYQVIDDEGLVADIESYALSARGRYKSIVVLGIGGSSLGTICMYQSLKHLFAHERSTSDTPRLYVLDNIAPELMRDIEDVIDFKQTLFVVISKSGGTPETLSQYLHFSEKFTAEGLELADHFVFVTDPERGFLRQTARELGISTFPVPANVGGRFSVLTAVGLLPAALVGIDIRALLTGARQARDTFLSTSFEVNQSYQLALIQYLLSKKGKTMTVMFPYSQKLVRLADWYRQLLAESIGKRLDRQGEEVHTGLTPIPALGVTDQHSQLQLYMEGPLDKLFIFLNPRKAGEELAIAGQVPEELSYLEQVSFNKLMAVEEAAVEAALVQSDHPVISLGFSEVNAETLGGLFMLFEGSIAFLGELYDIDAFDQPGVELAKNLTRDNLVGRL